MARAGLDKEQHQVAAMFDTIAPRYDVTNDVLSLGQDRLWRRATVRTVAAGPGDVVLDLAAGTGTSTAPLAQAGARVVACDLSVGMLARGRSRRPDQAFVVGDAMALPFADESFDAVTISFGLRNVPDVAGALAEMLRVTRPGGRLVVCELSTPVWLLRGPYELYLRAFLPFMVKAVVGADDAYTYLVESVRGWPAQRELSRTIQAAGWHKVAYRNLSGGIAALHRATRPL